MDNEQIAAILTEASRRAMDASQDLQKLSNQLNEEPGEGARMVTDYLLTASIAIRKQALWLYGEADLWGKSPIPRDEIG